MTAPTAPVRRGGLRARLGLPVPPKPEPMPRPVDEPVVPVWLQRRAEGRLPAKDWTNR